jgi:hypothetical protein
MALWARERDGLPLAEGHGSFGAVAVNWRSNEVCGPVGLP